MHGSVIIVIKNVKKKFKVENNIKGVSLTNNKLDAISPKNNVRKKLSAPLHVITAWVLFISFIVD